MFILFFLLNLGKNCEDSGYFETFKCQLNAINQKKMLTSSKYYYFCFHHTLILRFFLDYILSLIFLLNNMRKSLGNDKCVVFWFK